MVGDGFNEQGVGVASDVLELSGSSGDFSKSVVSPVDPGVGVLDLGGDAVGECSGVVEVSLVDVGNSGDLADGSTSDFFVSLVFSVSGGLDIDVLSLQVSEEIVDGLDGIIGSGTSLDKGSELGQISGLCDNCDKQDGNDGSH